MKTLGQRIYFARVMDGKRSMGQFGAEVAAAISDRKDGPYHYNTVSKWEHNRIVPDLKAVEAIARVCNVDLIWLIRGSGKPREEAA